MSERKQVPYDVAVQMLPDGNYVHTFVNGAPGMLLGTDWTKEDTLKAFGRYQPELSGPMATGMNHGLCIHDGQKWIFFQTKP